MDLNEFVANFANQFDETDPALFAPDTDFRQFDEWSSLIALSIIAMVDEEYDMSLKGEDIKSSNTIEDLYKIVSSKR